MSKGTQLGKNVNVHSIPYSLDKLRIKSTTKSVKKKGKEEKKGAVEHRRAVFYSFKSYFSARGKLKVRMFIASRRSCMVASITLVTAWLMLMISSFESAQAQSFVATGIYYVSKTRRWVRDTERAFKPDNRSFPAIPSYGQLVSPPRLSKFVTSVDSNGRLVVFGGEQENPLAPLEPLSLGTNHLYLYDFARNLWFNETQFFKSSPGPRVDHVAWNWNNHMYIHGGIHDIAYSDVWSYHNRTWTRLLWDGPRLYGHTAEAISSSVTLIFGGRDGTTYYSTLYRVTINGTFSKVAHILGPTPPPRAYHASAVMTDKTRGVVMYIFGGSDGTKKLSDLWIYIVTKNTWIKLNDGYTGQVLSYDGTLVPPVSIPGVARHACVASFPTIMCVGGSPTGTTITVEYDVSLNRWLRMFFYDATALPPLDSHRAVLHDYGNTVGLQFLAIGGITGPPLKFTTPVTITRTDMHTQACPYGYFNPDQDGKCFPCPLGSALDLGVSPHKCQLCVRGTYSRNGECRKCPVGTYNPLNGSSNITACLSCPPGYFTVVAGSYSASQCKTCLLGTYANNGICLPCPPGTYGALPGQLYQDLGCKPCPYGNWSYAGSALCTGCPAGTSSGPFSKRLYSNYIAVQGMAAGGPSGSYAGCPGGVPASIVAGNWFYVPIAVRDIGGANVYTGFGSAAVTVEFESANPKAVMYVGCTVSGLPNTCGTSVGQNVTYTVTNADNQAPCYSLGMATFLLRFDHTSNYMKLSFRSGRLHPASISFAVTASALAGSPKFGPNSVAYVTGLADSSLRITATDITGEFDPLATWSFSLFATCLYGTPSPTFRVGAGPVAATQTLTFVAGVVQPAIKFVGVGRNCTWKATAATNTIISPYPSFTIQTISTMTVTPRTQNVSNYGIIYLDVFVRNSTGDIVTGDSSSKIKLSIWPSGPYAKSIHFKQTNLVRTFLDGHAFYALEVFTNYTYETNIWTRFVITYLSGVTPLLSPVETPNIYIRRTNGTILRQVTDEYPFPDVIAAGKTMIIQVESVNAASGQQDSRRNIIVDLRLSGCPTTTIAVVNRTALIVPLLEGRGTVHVLIGGADATNCRIHIGEHNVPDPLVKGFWTPAFRVSTPHNVTQDHCVSSCASCSVDVGQIVQFNITILAGDGSVAVHDSSTIVRLVVNGTSTSNAYPTDGDTERRVTSGRVSFKVFMGPSMTPYQFIFEAGYWQLVEHYNITYATVPTFIRYMRGLGEFRTFFPSSYITPAVTCTYTPGATATKILFNPIQRIPTWVQSATSFSFSYFAANNYNVLDQSYVAAATLTINNCHHGYYLATDLKWEVVNSDGTKTAYTAGMALKPFGGGKGSVTLMPTFTTDTDLTKGVLGCSILIKSGSLQKLIVEGFAVNHIYPACESCPPGTWSGGGNGKNTSYTNHYGGCIPCMVGTFSTRSGAIMSDVCEVCPQGYGYGSGNNNVGLEGLTTCGSSPCTTNGLPGGGNCPAGYVDNAISPYGYYGTEGKRCNLAVCLAGLTCSAGDFRLSCTSFGTVAACSDPYNRGVCWWNATSLLCQGPAAICIGCPAGRYSGGGAVGIGGCAQCGEGGWTTLENRTSGNTLTLYRSPYNCGTWLRYILCAGSNYGICWNGTYSSAQGQTSNSTCVVCPKGSYCYQQPLYTHSGSCTVCPAGTQLNEFCTGCPCPQLAFITWGAVKPLPCPPGTYNNVTGQSDPSACFPCPAGTYCPSGSAEPTWADTANTQTDLSGTSIPAAVSFEQNNDYYKCGDPTSFDAMGYLRDGHFSDHCDRYRDTSDGGETWGLSFVEAWKGTFTVVGGGHNGAFTPACCIRMNATGYQGASQSVAMKLVMTSPLVARVWVYNGLIYRNISITMKRDFSRYKPPFAGFEVELFSTPYWSNVSKHRYYQTRSINVGATYGAWHLLELTLTPPFPVQYATFNLTCNGWYLGYALFDDAALRPPIRTICNCSTGFFYNESSPTSKKCFRCPPGFACSGGTLKRCEKSYSNSGQPGCSRCRDGWLCDADGRGRAIPCALYHKKDSTTETCSPCPLGYACRDGVPQVCNAGKYGDGGLDCLVCKPGFYSLDTAPQIECLRCPPGTYSPPGRSSCTYCPVNHYSPNGTACFGCPFGMYAPRIAATACRPCTEPFLEDVNVSVARNSMIKAIRVIPAVCESPNDFVVEQVQPVSGSSLGTVTISTATPSVQYNSKNTLGRQVFYVYVTSRHKATMQRVMVEVTITNNAPVAQNDYIIIAHPNSTTTFDIKSVLFNDYDIDKDNVYFASGAAGVPNYWSGTVTISADQKTMTVVLPAGYTGPGVLTYRVMDRPAGSPAACISPVCKMSNTASVTILSKQTPPVAVDDSFSVFGGEVSTLDVLLNDTDRDGDEITVVSVVRQVGYVAIRQTCPTVGGACQYGSPSACRGLACTCTWVAQRNKCYPSSGRQNFIDYTPQPTQCGRDTFTYTINTNDGASTATVGVRVNRCFCGTHTPDMDIIFLVDGTQVITSYNWQMTFVDAVQRRSTQWSNFYYAVLEAGAMVYLRNLSNTYIPTNTYQRNPNGATYPYDLAAALAGAGKIKTLTGNPARQTIVVVLSGAESTTNILYAASALSVTNGAHFLSFSINSLGVGFNHVRDLNPIFSRAFVSFDRLLATVNGASLTVEDTMDEICAQ